MITQDRDVHVQHAIESVLLLNRHLTLLLDHYDFYLQRYGERDQDFNDVQVSIDELGTLPKSIALQLEAWKEDREPLISREGFDEFVLSEFALHMHSLAMFLVRKKIDLDPFDPREFGTALSKLRQINREITSRN